jgi:hypothetical protein
MKSFQACNAGNIKRATMGDTSDTVKLLPGTRFHLDFGFIRASSLDVGVTVGHRSVTYYDGNTTLLLIFCAKANHTWVFFQPSKAPPIHIRRMISRSQRSQGRTTFFAHGSRRGTVVIQTTL